MNREHTRRRGTPVGNRTARRAVISLRFTASNTMSRFVVLKTLIEINLLPAVFAGSAIAIGCCRKASRQQYFIAPSDLEWRHLPVSHIVLMPP